MEDKKECTEIVLPKEFTNGRGIQYLLDISARLLGNPMLIIDLTYNILAHTEFPNDDPIANELMSEGQFSHETVCFFKEEKFIEAVAVSDVVASLKSDKLEYDRICSKLFNNNDLQIGSIIILESNRKIDPTEYALIEKISEIISIELRESKFYMENEFMYDETIISDLIDGKTNNKVFSEKRLNRFYKDLKGGLYVAVVDISQYDPTVTHLVYLRDLFKKIEKGYKYFIYLNYIVVLISSDSKIFSLKKNLIQLQEFFVKYKIYAGLSDSFQNLFELQKHYKQALNALNYGMNSRIEQAIYKYNDFKIDYFLNYLKSEITMGDLCNPIVLYMKEYDNDNNTMYYDITETYLIYGRNTQLTCAKMKISHEHLHSSLKEMEVIFDIDWNNGNLLYSMVTTFKVLSIMS